MRIIDRPSQTDSDRIATAISDRVATLLRATVRISDEHGQVVAASSRRHARSRRRARSASAPLDIRLPLRLESLAGEVMITPPVDDAEVISPRLASALLELVIHDVTVVDQLPNQHDLKNRFIYDLLRGTAADLGAARRDAKLLGMNLDPPRAVLLIDAADYIVGDDPEMATPDEIRRRSQLVIASIVDFFRLPDDTICASSGDGEVAVLKASDGKNLEHWVEPPGAVSSSSWADLAALKRAGRALLVRLHHDTGSTINIGIGRYHPGIPGLARSYQDAQAALALGRLAHGQNRVHSLEGLGIPSFVGLADEQTKQELAAHLLSPLDDEPELIETVRVFFAEDCSPSTTAERLAIHRNTLAYRLDKITSMTGLNPRRFDDAVQIRLALVLRSLHDRPRPTAQPAA